MIRVVRGACRHRVSGVYAPQSQQVVGPAQLWTAQTQFRGVLQMNSPRRWPLFSQCLAWVCLSVLP